MFKISKSKTDKKIDQDIEALPLNESEGNNKNDDDNNNNNNETKKTLPKKNENNNQENKVIFKPGGDSTDDDSSDDDLGLSSSHHYKQHYATYHAPSVKLLAYRKHQEQHHHPHHQNHLQRLFKHSESEAQNDTDQLGRLSSSQSQLSQVRFDLPNQSEPLKTSGSKNSLFKSSYRNLSRIFQVDLKERLKEKVERNYNDPRIMFDGEQIASVTGTTPRRSSDRNDLLAQIKARNEGAMGDEIDNKGDNNHLQIQFPRTPSRTPPRTPSQAARNRNQSTYFPGRIRKRVILKNGAYNLSQEHLNKRSRRYLQDMFTTMVDIKWRWNLMVFALGFLSSWLGFGIVWWLIAFSHSDFEHVDDENWTPCVTNMKNFISALLFSIETQHTIGYGSRFTTEECPEAVFVMCLQSVTGVMISCFMVGFIFAKLSRPQKRSQTLMFSRNAIVCVRDNKLCIMFRVGDLRNRSHIIGGKISALVIQRKISPEGEVIPYYHRNMAVKFDEVGDDVFLIWPATIVHTIDENSPFWEMNSDDMMNLRFEIVAILEGTVESTGQSIQTRTSYLPSEILWGYRFEQLIKFRKETCEYIVDYAKFNSAYEIDTPMCSAKEFQENTEKEENINWDFLQSRMDVSNTDAGAGARGTNNI